ncbi:MAG: helix-turn-helix transcriptional regulator [Pseudomonadota bacterium]|nr:helix-turn-helix transcriptional regulator [Pseudomonadota bacterium]
MTRNLAAKKPERVAQTRSGGSIDAHVGAHIRMRRMLLGLTQAQLASSIGVSSQQVQLYERGVSPTTASMLYTAAKTLQAHVEFFFEDIPGYRAGQYGTSEASPGGMPPSPEPAFDPLQDGRMQRETRALIRAYYRIKNQDDRRTILDLVRRLGAGQP